METTSIDHEGKARELVQESISVAIEKHKVSEEVVAPGNELDSSFNKTSLLEGEEEEIAEEFDIPRRRINSRDDSEIAPDSLEEHDDGKSVSSVQTESSKSSSSSSSTTSSSHSSDSSRSSLEKTKPCRLAQTFKKGDLMSEMNKTKTISKKDEYHIPVISKGTLEATKTTPRICSWIDPKSVKGTEDDAKKMEEWVTQKDREKKKRLQEARREKNDKEQRVREEEANKAVLQKKNFELWENKKKLILEQKIKKSEEMKARKKQKEQEKVEKLKDNEKAFQNWKSYKDDSLREKERVARAKRRGEEEERIRLAVEKKQEQKRGFEKWMERHEELEKQKRKAEQAAKEAEDELVVMEEYRKQDAEEEYVRWKEEKSQKKCSREHSVQHPLAWSPAGRSDGKHRTSPNSRAPSPGEPLSKTLANLKNYQSYTRKLKTVDVCCRQISFWCHCHSENGVHGNESPSFHPEFASTSRTLGGMMSPLQLSRHTTPVNSRPSTPHRRKSGSK